MYKLYGDGIHDDTLAIQELIDNMIVDNVSFENHTNEPMPLFDNNGIIKELITYNLRTDGDDIIVNNGKIG